MLTMTAFGPEANFGSPREALQGWSVELRTGATHRGMPGMDMAALMRGEEGDGGDGGDGGAPADEP